MKTSVSTNPACRHCRYYIPEGRRGGYCQQLNVSVKGGWKACSLAIPPFVPSWENLEQIMRWQQQALVAQAMVSGTDEVGHQEVPVPEPIPVAAKPEARIRALWM